MPRMQPPMLVLLVDGDKRCARTLARLLRSQGSRVQVCHTRAQALAAVRRKSFDLAVVDLFSAGGGVELAREIARRVPRVVLSLGMGMQQEEVLEAALGFPVHRKAALPALVAPPEV